MATFIGTMNTQRYGKAILVACLLLLSLPAAPDASAARPASSQTTLNEPAKVVVRYGDLNLSSDAGAEVLLRRLEQAARQVCGDPRERRPLAEISVILRCNAQSLERAIEAVGAQKLTAAYQSKYGSTARNFTARTSG
jgi:UrcA family protein